MNNSLNRSEIKYLIVSTSIIFTEFYYFYWGSRALISSKYLIYNTFFLFVFSLLFFYLFFYLKEKFNKKLKYVFIIYLTFVYFKIFQIPFFYANTTSLKSLFVILFKSIFNEKIFFLIPFLKIIVPFGIIYSLFVIFSKKHLNVILRFMYSFSLIFLIFMAWDASKRIYHLEKNDLKTNQIKTNRKVVWFIFDEYDPQYFTKSPFDLKLNHIVELAEKSLIHYKSYSPSNYTLNSVPSILMETKISNAFFKNYKLVVKNETNDEINFNFKNTFFDKLLKNNLNFKIYSEVLPYCSMLNIETSCAKNFNQIKYYFDGIKFIYNPTEYLKKLNNLYYTKTKLEKFNLNKLNSLDNYKKDNIFLSKKLKISTNNLKSILKEKNNLVFFHLFVPHTKVEPSKYIKKIFNMNPVNDDQEYMLNLKYTDLIIKEILNAIKNDNNQDILLLLTSDHWRRNISDVNPKPSLFIAKIKNQDLGLSVNQKNLNIFIPDLILKYLNGEINTYDNMNSFFKDLPIFNENDVNIKLKFERNHPSKVKF